MEVTLGSNNISGTTAQFLYSEILSLIHFRSAGSAHRLIHWNVKKKKKKSLEFEKPVDPW